MVSFPQQKQSSRSFCGGDKTFKNNSHNFVTSRNEDYPILMKKTEFCVSRLNNFKLVKVMFSNLLQNIKNNQDHKVNISLS